MEHTDARPERTAALGFLAEPMAWFIAATAGMIIVFVGLAIDAWRHNNGAGEESLLSIGNPGHLVAGIGLAVTSIAVLVGLSVASLKNVATADNAIRRMVPVTAAWVVLATVAFSSITYIGASGVTVGHSHDDGAGGGDGSLAAADDGHDDHEDTTGGDAGVAKALEDMGIDLDDAEQVQGALTQGSNGEPGGAHDHGKHPTFTQLVTLSDNQLMPQFPEGTLSAADLPLLRDQVRQVRAVAEKYPTVEAANAAGFFNTTSDVPFMGQHFINRQFLLDGKFDPNEPEGLLFSKVDDGPEKLVGVWFLLLPGVGDTTRTAEPAGFAGGLDLWHAHVGLCLVGTSGASEGETRESCQAKGGNFTADLRWMMHVWVAPETTENADGFFAYLNGDLYEKQAAAKAAAGEQSGTIPE